MISVIIPVHNTEKYLEMCLKSIINQTYKDLEIICINSSTDGSEDIIKRFQNEDFRIRLINDANSSYGYKINLGISNAIGDYISIIDSDDYVQQEMYADLLPVIEQNELDFIKSNYASFCDNEMISINKCIEFSKLYNKTLDKSYRASILQNGNICIWTGLYKKTFLTQNHISLNESPGASFQDTGFAFQTYATYSKCYFSDKYYYMYRTDNVSSSVKDVNKAFTVIYESNFIEDKIKKYNLSLNCKRAIKIRLLEIFYWNYCRLTPEIGSEFSLKIKNWLINFDKEFNLKSNFASSIQEEFYTLLNAKNDFDNGLIDFAHAHKIRMRNVFPDICDISIIIYNSNTENLYKMLDSLLQQDYLNSEIIIVSDEYTERLNKYKLINSTVKIISKDKNISELLIQIHGEYVLFVNDYHEFYNNSINNAITFMKKLSCDLLFINMYYSFNSEQFEQNNQYNNMEVAILDENNSPVLGETKSLLPLFVKMLKCNTLKDFDVNRKLSKLFDYEMTVMKNIKNKRFLSWKLSQNY